MSNNPLARDFSFKKLLSFTLPSVFMMIFMSTYTIIDGIFVAQLVGEDALSAVNLIYPLFGIVLAIGLMFATGGNAIISRFIGEGRTKTAREFLSTLYIIGITLGIVLSSIAFIFPEQILSGLNVSESLYPYAKDYLYSLAGFAAPVIMLVYIQSFLVTDGKPTLGLILCVSGGLLNILLDYVLISPDLFNMGIAGAGIATGLGNALPGLIGLIYFFGNKKGTLFFVKPNFNLKLIINSMYNGSSELVNSLSISITTLMFNFILLDMVGDSGVAAISVILYIQQFQTAIYFGYTLGVAPIIGYKYGAQQRESLHKVVKMSFVFVSIVSALVIVLTLIFANQAVEIFLSPSSSTFEMARNGLLMFTPSYLFMGYNVFLSSMYTALSNGKVSAIISIARSLVFIVLSLLILPQILHLTGVWIAIPVAEFLSIFIAIYYYKKLKEEYGY